MKRRKFLKKIVKLSPMLVLPTTVVSSLLSVPEVKSEMVTLGEWTIDEETKSIIYQGGWKEDGINTKDVYDFMKDDWIVKDEEIPFKFPVIREFGPEYNYKKVWQFQKIVVY
jgi:hypothetical protein